MSWSSWGAKLNVQSIVSQGLEQVSKLKEDVEKQFDQVVASSATQPPGSSSRTSASAAAAAANGTANGVSSVTVEPPSAALNAALFGDLRTPEGHPAIAPPPPPRSMDGKSSSAALLASLGLPQPRSSDDSASTSSIHATPSSAPTSMTSKGGKQSAADFFGSFLPPEQTPPSSDRGNRTTTVSETEACPVKESTPVETEKDLEEEEKTQVVETEAVEDEEEKEEKEEMAREEEEDKEVEADAVEELVEKEIAEIVNGDDDEGAETLAAEADEGASSFEEHNHSDEDSGTCEEVAVEDASPDDDGEMNGHRECSTDAPVASAAVELSAFSEQVMSLKQQLHQRETQLMSTSEVIQELHDELDKTCQREVAAVERNRFLTEQLELLRQEVLRLNRVIVQHQQQPSRDQELVALQQAVAEKDTKLQALLDEGQALSVKQSQLEQRLRQLRREKNEEEEQKLKLQAQSDTLAIQVEELTLQYTAAEEEKKRLQGELKNAQQTAEQATNQFMTTEEELSRERETTETLQEQVVALSEANESLRAELDNLEHTSASHATLSVEKSEMESTIQYLQQTVHDLEGDATRREEMARMEIADLKRKWKDALQRVDALGLSVSEATQPLLRQIHALQEDQRARQETWKATEATLLQRIHDASAQRKSFESEKLSLEQQLHDVKSQVEDLELEKQRRVAEIQREKDRVEATQQKEREARSRCDALQIELDELKLKLQDEQHVKQTLLARVASTSSNDGDAGKRDVEMQQSMAETASLVAEMKQREEKLRHDLEWHQKELQRVKAATSSPRMTMMQQRRSFDDEWTGSASDSPRFGASQTPSSQASILQRTLDSSMDDSRLSSTSVLGLSQLQQRLRLREGENRMLRQQLQTIEDRQKQTTDEIVRLSTRNALLESSASEFEETQLALVALKQKQHVLLELFGEKEEQVEELQAEVKELKAFYRKQLDTLARHQQ